MVIFSNGIYENGLINRRLSILAPKLLILNVENLSNIEGQMSNVKNMPTVKAVKIDGDAIDVSDLSSVQLTMNKKVLVAFFRQK